MKILRITLILWIGFLIAITTAQAETLTIEATPQTVQKGEGVTVTVTAKGKQIIFPSLDHIGSYPISAPSIRSKDQVMIVNGSISTLHQKTMRFTLFPDRNITIPPLNVQIDGKTEQTRPLSIRVTTHPQTTRGQNGYRLRMIPSSRDVYVGQPLVLDVVFFEPRNSQVAQAQYIPPKFDGFFVKSDDQEQLQQEPQGTSHIFTYILTPQKEGNFTISAPQIKLGIKTFNAINDPWGLFNNEVRWQALQAAPVTIHVRPVPAGVDWVGSLQMNATVDTRQVAADKPVNYTLTIDGNGSLDDIDEPEFDLSDVTVYSNDAQVESRIQNGQVISHWVKKYTFIADHDFTIPALRKKVFNPRTGQVVTLETPAYTIHVTGSAATEHAGIQTPTPSDHTSAPRTAQATPAATAKPAPSRTKANTANKENNRSLLEDTAWYAQQAKEKTDRQWPLWALILAFLTGIIATIIAMKILPKLRRKRAAITRHRHYSIDEALAILYPHTNDSPEIEAMVRELYRAKQDTNISIDQKKLGELIEQVAGSR